MRFQQFPFSEDTKNSDFLHCLLAFGADGISPKPCSSAYMHNQHFSPLLLAKFEPQHVMGEEFSTWES